MSKQKTNVLFICSDQHSRYVSGCYGNDCVHTPHLDELAQRGKRYTRGYSNNPICVPARASMVTGQHCFQMGTWDNASPYTGQVKSFGHRLKEAGVPFTSIGKLHFRNETDDTGFDDQRYPMHVRKELGDIYGSVRTPEVKKPKLLTTILNAGCGDSDHLRYDRKITQEGLAYLQDEAVKLEQPWVLYLGYILPHQPFITPEHTYELYKGKKMPMPLKDKIGERTEHPTAQAVRQIMNGQDIEIDPEVIEEVLRVYYSMVTFMDEQIGMIVEKLKELGMYENTRIIYTTDHGDSLGQQAMWYKNSLYEDAVGIPMLISGPDIAPGVVDDTNVSLVDIYPTILDCVGVELDDYDKSLPGKSLLSMEPDAQRSIFCEYHGIGSLTGGFMIKSGDYKYLHYVGYPHQLFHTPSDPHDLNDLADKPEYAHIVEDLRAKLFAFVTPEEIDKRAKADQAALVARHGGKDYVLNNVDPVFYSPVPDLG